MSTPDKNMVKMLHPPEKAVPPLDPLSERVYTNLTKSDKRRYQLLCKDKKIKFAFALREGLKLFFDGDKIDTLQTVIQDFMKTAVHYREPSKYVRKAIGSEWKDAEVKAKERKLIEAIPQTEDHIAFMGDCVPELKEVFKNKKKGLSSIPKKEQKRERPKTNQLAYKEWYLKKHPKVKI